MTDYDDIAFTDDATAVREFYEDATGYVLPAQPGATTGNKSKLATIGSLMERATPRWRGDALPNLARQNPDQDSFVYGQPWNPGSIEAPPMARHAAHKGLDLIAHWFNPWGTQWLNVPGEANGDYDLIDWSWNWGSYPHLEPTLGWYAGDDPDVLDWTAYWLIEAGINVVSLLPQDVIAGFSRSGWTTSTDESYWIYRYLTQTPNARGLRYVLWGGSGGTTTSIEASHDDIIETAGEVPGAYTYTHDGKCYLGIYMWDMESIRGVYDSFSGQTNTVAMLKGLAGKCQTAGYDGVLVLARNGGYVTSEEFRDPTLLSAGALVVDADYENRYGDDTDDYGDSYATYAATAPFPTGRLYVPTVVTSAKSHPSHPSAWSLDGSTPALFALALARAAQSVVDHQQLRILSIYNVAEWLEGGPGLIPNVADGWGYLDAVKRLPTYPAATLTATSAVAWIEVEDFEHSWENFGSGIQPLRYRKVGDEVQVQGLIKGGASGSIFFTLPPDCHPPMPIAAVANISLGGLAQVDVDQFGQMSITQVTGAVTDATAVDVRFSVL